MEIIINEKDLTIVKNKDKYYVIYEHCHSVFEQWFLDKYNGDFTEVICTQYLSESTIKKLKEREEYIYEIKTYPNAKLEDFEEQIKFYQKMVLGKKEVE